MRNREDALCPIRILSGPRGNDVEEDGEVVGHTAGQHKQVPEGVEVTQPVEGEKDDAQRLSQASGAHPQQAVPAERVNQRPHGNYCQPALR